MNIKNLLITGIASSFIGSILHSQTQEATHPMEIVPNSLSPDRKLQIAVQVTDDQPLYRVATRDMQFLQGSFPSNYWLLDQCLRSSVFWREDGAYVVIQEVAGGVHQQFVMAQKTGHGYSALPFDRNEIIKPSKLSWHHGAVRFDRWLPKDRVEVTIYGDLDVSRADFECAFVLDLKHNLRVLSCRIIKPK